MFGLPPLVGGATSMLPRRMGARARSMVTVVSRRYHQLQRLWWLRVSSLLLSALDHALTTQPGQQQQDHDRGAGAPPQPSCAPSYLSSPSLQD